MQLATAYEVVPDDEDLLYSIEYWSEDKITTREAPHSDGEVEAFVHPKTATAARIIQADDGTYSVQPSMGDYDNGDCVLQPDERNSSVSGGASVTMVEMESLSEARSLAYAFMRGWVMRNGGFYENAGSVIPADLVEWADPIE